MRVGLVVGHTPGKDKGAYSETLQSTEFDYWLPVVRAISDELSDMGAFCMTAIHDERLEYYERQKKMANHLNKYDLDLVIELHFNAASPLANGTETLYWFGSKKGSFAASYCSTYIANRAGTRLRGDNGRRALANKNDRGYWFAYLQKAPAIILEPFFGSNPEDSLKFSDRDYVAKMMAQMLFSLLQTKEFQK